jgi:arylsulfatase A-like enzyme
MNKVSFFFSTFTSSLCLISVTAQNKTDNNATNKSTEIKPNILWLTFEDTSPQFIGCYGNKSAKTPNIDNLAKDGIRFINAYANGAVSSASRFCLITGLRTSQMGTGHHRSSYSIPEKIKGFPYYLRKAGYYTSNNSKTDYNVANAAKFIREAWDESSDKAGWWNRNPGQPFFCVYNSMASHQSRTMTYSWQKYEDLVLKNLNKGEIIPEGNLPIPDFYRDSPEMQRNMSRVYNSISLMDKEFGQWLRRLEKDGLKDSTIIFCFSDHGEGITRSKGSALATGYKVAFVAWIPPMYKHLSPWGDGVVTDELVSFEDMAPTVLRLAGVELPDYMKGRAFMGTKPEVKRKYVYSAVDRTDESSELSRSVSDGRYLYTRVFMPFQPFVRWNMYYDVSDLQKNIRADYKAGLLNEQQRSILEVRQPEYLFDTQNDKWTTENIVKRPELNTKVDELRVALKNQIIKDRDPHFIPEYSLIQAGKNPYSFAVNNKTYPVQNVLNAALTVGKGEVVIEKQLQLMNDSNDFVRYWASMGLFAQRSNFKKVEKKIEKLYKNELYAPTKINLAVLLFKNSNKKKYLKNVKQIILQETDPELLRIALHLLISTTDSKLNTISNDIQMRLYQNKQNKVKSMFTCNEYMTLMLHRSKGIAISADD